MLHESGIPVLGACFVGCKLFCALNSIDLQESKLLLIPLEFHEFQFEIGRHAGRVLLFANFPEQVKVMDV